MRGGLGAALRCPHRSWGEEVGSGPGVPSLMGGGGRLGTGVPSLMRGEGDGLGAGAPSHGWIEPDRFQNPLREF